MTRHPLRQIDLVTEEKLHRSKKPRDDARCKAFHASILSGSPLGCGPRPVPYQSAPGLRRCCNPLIPGKLRLFSALRCYNRRAIRIVLGENSSRRRPAAPLALVAPPPGQQMGGSRLRRYRAPSLAPSLRLLQELRFAYAAG